jgi:hypothetical protein
MTTSVLSILDRCLEDLDEQVDRINDWRAREKGQPDRLTVEEAYALTDVYTEAAAALRVLRRNIYRRVWDGPADVRLATNRIGLKLERLKLAQLEHYIEQDGTQ